MRHYFYGADSGASGHNKSPDVFTTVVNEEPAVPERAQSHDFAEESSHYDILFENNPQPMWIFDKETHYFVEVNAMAIRQYGYSREEFLRLKLTDIRPPEDIERFHEAVNGPTPRLPDTSYRRHIRRDGSLIDVRIFYQEIVYHNRPALIAAIEDLSELHEAARERETAHRVLLEVLESISDGFLSFDRELRFTYVNAAAEQFLQRSREELVGLTLGDAFPNSIGQPYYEQVLATKNTVVFETHYEVTGQWLEVRAVPTIDGISVFFCDITDRRQADIKLRASEEWYRALSEYGSDVIYVLGERNNIVYVSRSIERLLGYTAEQLVGYSVLYGVHDEDIPILADALAQLRSGQALVEGIIYRLRHTNGEWRFIESTGSDQTANPGVAGLVLYARDVTERIQLQNQLIHSAKLAALGELVAGVAHEINNPLAAISGLAQLLGTHSDLMVREDALAIRGMVDRATKIVQSLRGFAQSDTGGISRRVGTATKVAGSLNRVAQSAFQMVGASLRHHSIEVQLHLEDDLPSVLMTASELEQVVVNLLNNAAYAVREREIGTRLVTVTTFSYRTLGALGRESLRVSLLVSDNGPGMESAVHERIFEPFYSSKERGEGTGLGLYISYGIVSSHGGTLDVISSPGAGATFTITLPAMSE